MLKKISSYLLAVAFIITVFSANNAFAAGEVLDKDGKLLAYYTGSVFYADKEKTKPLFYHPGNQVGTAENITDENRLYRLTNGLIIPKSSYNRKEAIATLIETAWRKGYTKEAKIYVGHAQVRDKVEARLDDGTVKLDSYNVTVNGSTIEEVPVLFTIKDSKIYKGDSTNEADVMASFTPDEFSDSRLLFIAVEFLLKNN